ncbi:MAG TPA: tRNA (cytidine(34)-2'-O)-methyltransferase [Candidatus Limnocylindrales bacterium]|nr:tRNA (cytidine(34)-2'-O)-methyltransferase [Candidatus Limnocylindrales bacterium]
MRIVLLEPEIPPNTGSVARLAAATQTPLDLIGPLGFSLEDRYLKRAGLDYWPWVDLTVYDSWQQYLAAPHRGRLLGLSARATRSYTEAAFCETDRLLFGKETSGLGADIISMLGEHVFTIPMSSPHVRSLNLANAVSIVVYEARRQLALV